MELSLDFETFSESELKQVGTYRYCTDRTTKALLLGWAIDNEPASVWDIASGEPMPRRLSVALINSDVPIWAFNATFERLMLVRIGCRLPINRFHCTMVLAYSLGFAGNLDQCLERFHLSHRKDSEGSRLIQRFCKPQPQGRKVALWDRHNDPEGWESFKHYCGQDVEVERALRHRASVTGVKVHWPGYHLDQEINHRGLPIDLNLVDLAIDACDIERGNLVEAAIELTGLDNPNSRDQMLGWLNGNGLGLPDLTKDTVAQALLDPCEDENVREALILRQQLAKTSTSKWEALRRSHCHGRIKGAFQFVGAGRTGRWAGRIAQPHNWPRPLIKSTDLAIEALEEGGHALLSQVYERPMDVLSSCLRGSITAPPGEMLVVSDLSSIEGRVAGWITGCGAINQIFKDDRDLYRALASVGLGKTEDEVTKDERNFYKPAALGAQYGLSGRGLVAYAAGMGVEIQPKEAEHQIGVYRESYPEVQGFWWLINEAFLRVVITQTPETVCGMLLQLIDHFLSVTLPSGRRIYYYLPLAELKEMPWGETKLAFTYMGKHRITTQWTRLQLHGGLALENICQAIARDILMVGIIRAAKMPILEVIGHVHDEVVGLSEEGDRALPLLNECLSTSPGWAADLILGAEGYVAKRYRK